jgi:hypothetical protein
MGAIRDSNVDQTIRPSKPRRGEVQVHAPTLTEVAGQKDFASSDSLLCNARPPEQSGLQRVDEGHPVNANGTLAQKAYFSGDV